jgi:hypothetical protein
MDTQENYIVKCPLLNHSLEQTVTEILDKYGVAIIPNILTPEECEEGIDEMWQYLEALGIGIHRDEPETYVLFYQLLPCHAMLLQHWKIGHAKFAWRVRQHPKVVDVFAKLYGVEAEELVSSMDGVSIHFPPEITGRGWRSGTEITHYHTDQSYMRPEKDTIQAWVNFFDTNTGDATLAFWESSHLFHAEFIREFGEDIKEPKKDWFQLKNPRFLAFYQARCKEKRVVCPKGSLVLWDSRTIHTGIACERTRTIPNYRTVVYVCYQPRTRATEKQLEKKRKAYQEKRMTSHHPINGRLFPIKPRSYGQELPITNIPDDVISNELTTLGKKLAGF